MKTSLRLLIVIAFLTGWSCKKDPSVPEPYEEPPVYDIKFEVPQGWPTPVYTFSNNPLSEAGFRLGRKLFYEVKLSRDNSISCGSCHQNFVAFAHSMHSLSHGVDNLLGTRNAPGLFNLNWIPLFMWDGGINHIESQPVGPITNPVEMDETLANVITKLTNDPAYPPLFEAAFGDPGINSQNMLRAMAQFMGMMTSSNSKYDKVKRGDEGVSFTSSESAGYALFQSKCASCHVEPLFTDYTFRNNGIAYNAALNDSGRAHITGLAADKNKFKVPSLRNVAMTSPYMHDGRFSSLQDCLNHYASGVQSTQNLDPSLTGGIPLTTQEMSDVIAFLQTLTDNSFLNDARFTDPN